MSKSYSPAWRLFTVIVFRPLLHILVRNKWEGQENIPKTGPVIIAPNHMSYADWGTDCLFFYEAGRYPTFLVKASAFKVPFIGKLLYGCGQIPVNRGAADAALALKQAEQALKEGAAVIIYPEGTATRDPDLWPMVAKTGVARLADAGQVALDVGHEHRHARRGQLLGQPLQRLGLAGAGRAGDQAVPVDHPQRQLDHGCRDDGAVVHAPPKIE